MGNRSSGLRLPASIPFTSLSLDVPHEKSAPKQRAREQYAAISAVQALAPPGGEIALDHALKIDKTCSTIARCLHLFAAATHIPAVALPTGRLCKLLIV